MDQQQKVLVGLSFVLLLASCILFWPVANTVLFAATVSVVLVPLLTRVEEQLWSEAATGRRHTLMAVAFTVLSLAAIILAVAAVVFVFVRNFDVLKRFGLQVAAKIEEVGLDLFGAPIDLQGRAGESLERVLGYVQGTFFAAAGVLVNLVIFTLILFLLLRHGRMIRNAAREALPSGQRGLFDRFTNVTHYSLYAIYVVHGATVLITVVLAAPFFYLIGFGEHVLFWSVLCGSFQLIPVLGPSLIMVAIAIYGFGQGDTTTGLLVLLVGYPLVAALPDFFFRPLMLRSGMKMEAAILIVGFFAGIVSLGMIGFVLGPLILKLLVEALRLTREPLTDLSASGGVPG